MQGDRPEALRWTPEGQVSRYRQFLEITDDINAKKILDYGCGKGDFYGFLKDNGITADYTGTDITPGFVRLAKKKYPECSFRVFDIEEEELCEDFDFVFLCGVFNNRIEGIEDTMKNVIKKLFEHTREGLAFNALSAFSRDKSFELNYIDPGYLLGFVLREITPYVSLRHDGKSLDFTVFLYKNPKGY